MTNRQILSIVILMLCGVAFYAIPSQTEDGDNVFLSGASLLPDLAVSLIFVFTVLELVLSFLPGRRSTTDSPVDTSSTIDTFSAIDKSGKSSDVIIRRNQIFGVSTVACLLTGYGFFMFHLGYVVSSTLLLICLMVCAGGRRPVLMITVAIAISTILFIGLRFGFGTNINALPGFLD